MNGRSTPLVHTRRLFTPPEEAGAACPFRLANTLADVQAYLAADGVVDLGAEFDTWVGRTRDIALGKLRPWETPRE